VPSTPRGDALEGHIVRNSIVIINVKHTLLHADHFVAVVGAAIILPALKITVEAALIFTGKTLVLLPISAVAVAITVPLRPPIPIPIAVPIPFPVPIAVAVPASTAIGGYIAIGSICRNAVALIDRLHPLFHAAAFPEIVSALVTLPAREIAVKTALIINGKLASTPLCERGSQQD